jgi:head-tail adaptor
MPALSAAELTAMRAVEDETMSSTCVIERATYAADGMGGRTETWAAVGTVVCDLYPINSRADRERYTGGQIQSIGGWFVTVPTSTDVLARDRLLIDSRTFEVTFVPNDADHLTALQVEAKTYNEERRNQNFVQPAASFTGAYDAVPSITAAYGMRRLRTAYTGSILRIRRSSDNAEQDINAVANGDLDTAAVSSFIGGGSGYIVNWYDQSGNGYTAAQTTAASQPMYVASGQNGKPVGRWDGVNDVLQSSQFSASEAQPNTLIMVGKSNNLSTAIPPMVFVDGVVSGGRNVIVQDKTPAPSNNYWGLYAGGADATAAIPAIATNVHSVLTGIINGASSLLYQNGVQQSLTRNPPSASYPGSNPMDGVSIGGRYLKDTFWANGDIAELIICNAALSTGERQAAEAAANNYWAVY